MKVEIRVRDKLDKRLQQRVKKEVQQEYVREITSLKKRDDFSQELEYFLDVLSLSVFPTEFGKRFNKPCAGIYCIQAPLELFDAFGFHPIRLCSGSLAAQRLSSAFIPALACPVIKSCLGNFYIEESLENLCSLIIIPTTCDWNTKLPEMIGDKGRDIHMMELPHIKESERGQKRWLEEVYELKKVLQQYSGRRLNRRWLLMSINKYMKAWRAFGQLVELRREKGISGTWGIILANAFMVDDVETWAEKIDIVLRNYSRPKKEGNPEVFLAGSPVLFPYLKISELIEEAGMFIAADELCTSQRNLVSAPVYDEPSEYAIIKALAERYMSPCSCPTFTDNDRRVRNIVATMRTSNIKGVVYHLLKGCHPYDIESYYFEKVVKENGLKFIKIETDYSREDRQNILIRLEAFRETLY